MKSKTREKLESAVLLLESANESEAARVALHPKNICYSDFLKMSDDEVFELMSGSAITDDPPDGWSKKRLANFLRGYLYAEFKRARAAIHSYQRPMRFITEALSYEAPTATEQGGAADQLQPSQAQASVGG